MKSRIFTILITTIILFGFNSNIYAQKQDGKRKQFKDELNLSAEQEEQIDALRYQHQKLVMEKKNEIEKNRFEIRHMMATNKIDAVLLQNLTKKNSEIQSDLKQLRVQHWLDVYNLLDDTQKEIWTERFEDMGSKGRCMMDRDRFPGGDFERPGMDRSLENRGFRRNF